MLCVLLKVNYRMTTQSDYRQVTVMGVCCEISIVICLNLVSEVHLEMRKRVGRKEREKEWRAVKISQ